VPDASTRERVKQGVIAAIATGAIVSSAAHVSAHALGKSWLAGSLAAKITGVTLLGAVAAGSLVAPDLVASRLGPAPAPASAHKSHKTRVPPELPKWWVATAPEPPAGDTSAVAAGEHAASPEPVGPELEPASAEDSVSDRLGQPANGASSALPPPTGSLAAELRLLDRASRALSRGELVSARALLQQHRTSFANPVMVDEREGLELIVRCQLDATAAQADARAFLARAAHSVLSARVARACGRTR
jgi:hypothetical protein